jgi:hypothetical protein
MRPHERCPGAVVARHLVDADDVRLLRSVLAEQRWIDVALVDVGRTNRGRRNGRRDQRKGGAGLAGGEYRAEACDNEGCH